MNINLYNTPEKQVVPVHPISSNTIGIYSCGPTVYDYQHIGNYRNVITVDIFKRFLRFIGYDVNDVMNITDVGHLVSDQSEGEDKLQVKAGKEETTAWEIAKKYEVAYLKDLETLNVIKPKYLPRATEHIPEMIALIQKIEANGFTYLTEDGLYFDTSKDPHYSDFAHLDLSHQTGERGIDTSFKHNPADFALWKINPKDSVRHMEWDSPWGKGFPGWHIECSAMSEKYLGIPFDIHTGGADHIPVHHTNEVAQTRAASGQMIANIFMHIEFLQVDNKKMAKSDGTFITIADIVEKGIDPIALRYLYLTSHYRDKLNFTWDSLKAAESALQRIRKFAQGQGREDQQAKEQALLFLADDFKTPKFIAFLEEQNNPWLWQEFESILGFGLDKEQLEFKLTDEQKKRIEEREEFRKQGNYQKSDELREELARQGIAVEDTANGTTVTKI